MRRTFLLFALSSASLVYSQPASFYRALKNERCFTTIPQPAMPVLWGPGIVNNPVDMFSKDSIPIGFPVRINGRDYSYLRPCSNGYILLGGTIGMNVANEYHPDWAQPGGNTDYLAILQCEVIPHIVFYSTTGTTPDRVFILQYQNAIIQFTDTLGQKLRSEAENFEVKFYENSSSFEYNYQTTGGGGSGLKYNITIGIRTSQPQASSNFSTFGTGSSSAPYSDNKVHQYSYDAPTKYQIDAIPFPDYDVKLSAIDGAFSSVAPVQGSTLIPRVEVRNAGWLTLLAPIPVHFQVRASNDSLVYDDSTFVAIDMRGSNSNAVEFVDLPAWTVGTTSSPYKYKASTSYTFQDSTVLANDTLRATSGVAALAIGKDQAIRSYFATTLEGAVPTPFTGTAVTWNKYLAGSNAPQNTFSAAPIPIGFSFLFNDSLYTEVRPCSNGYMLMGKNSGDSLAFTADWVNIKPTDNRNYLAWYQSQIISMTGAQYLTSGTAPNRTFSILFQGCVISNQRATMDVLVNLKEGSNRIEFIYDKIAPANNSGNSCAPYNVVGICGAGKPQGFLCVDADDLYKISSIPTGSQSTTTMLRTVGYPPFDDIAFYPTSLRDLSNDGFDGMPDHIPARGDSIFLSCFFSNLSAYTISSSLGVPLHVEIKNDGNQIVFSFDSAVHRSVGGAGSQNNTLTLDSLVVWVPTDTANGYTITTFSNLFGETPATRKNDTSRSRFGDLTHDLHADSILNVPKSLPKRGDTVALAGMFTNIAALPIYPYVDMPLHIDAKNDKNAIVFTFDTIVHFFLDTNITMIIPFPPWVVSDSSTIYTVTSWSGLAGETSVTRLNDTVHMNINTVISVHDDRRSPSSFSISNYPNPFLHGTTFTLFSDEPVSLDIIDIYGRVIDKISFERSERYRWYSSERLPSSGMYIVRAYSNNALVAMRAIVCLK